AARNAASPAWSASMVHVPVVTKVSAPPEVTVQTPVVVDENETARLESDVAVSVGGGPKFCPPRVAEGVFWDACGGPVVDGAQGVTLFDAAEALPVPAVFVAVTVNV